MTWVVKIILASICTEAVVEVLQSRIFKWVRRDGDCLLAYFTRCGFCQSVWIALFMSLVFNIQFGLECGRIENLIATLVVFRFANLLHEAFNCVLGLGEILREKVFAVMVSVDAEGGDDEDSEG